VNGARRQRKAHKTKRRVQLASATTVLISPRSLTRDQNKYLTRYVNLRQGNQTAIEKMQFVLVEWRWNS
jgi:hypothetical protein